MTGAAAALRAGPAPLILGFDTSGRHCAACLLQGTSQRITRVEEMARGQAERLMPMLEEILAEAELSWAQLSAIGVGIGPGNFTGIRISVAAARGLALALDIPALGVSTFDATSLGQKPAHVAVVPAPRDQLYVRLPDAPPFLSAQPLQTDLPVVSPPPTAQLVENIARVAHDRLAAENASEHTQRPRPAPLYIKAADAAPPRDPAPTILP